MPWNSTEVSRCQAHSTRDSARCLPLLLFQLLQWHLDTCLTTSIPAFKCWCFLLMFANTSVSQLLTPTNVIYLWLLQLWLPFKSRLWIPPVAFKCSCLACWSLPQTSHCMCHQCCSPRTARGWNGLFMLLYLSVKVTERQWHSFSMLPSCLAACSPFSIATFLLSSPSLIHVLRAWSPKVCETTKEHC